MKQGLSRIVRVAALLLVLRPATGLALPPLERVLDGLEHFREATGHVEGEGRLTFATHHQVEVRLDRPWGEPPRLELDGETLVLDWADPQLDTALRLLGAALSAPDLGAALQTLGRSLEPEVQTIALIGEIPVYILGGPMGGAAAHISLERDTNRLRSLEVPMPDGLYRVELDGYDLAEGWFPSSLVVRRDEQPLLELQLTELSR